jgi:hypothetical protein
VEVLSDEARALVAGNTVAPISPVVDTTRVAELLGGTSTVTETTLSTEVPSVRLGTSTLTVIVLQHNVCARVTVCKAAAKLMACPCSDAVVQ